MGNSGRASLVKSKGFWSLKGRFSLLVCALVVGMLSPAEASYFDTFGVDARGMALGNAMTAPGEGWASVYYNPAALALSQNVEFSIGVCYAIPDINQEYASGASQDLQRLPGQSGGLKSIAGPNFGLVVPIQRLTPRKLPIPIAMGLGVFVPNQSVASTLVIDQSYPYDVLFQGRNNSLMINWGISTRISPALYIGVGLASQLVSGGTFSVSESGGGDYANYNTRFGAPSVLVGVLVRPMEKLRLGFVFRQKNEVRAGFDAVVETRLSLPLGTATNPTLDIVGQEEVHKDYVAAFTPDTFSFGGSYKITERMLATVQVDWVRWSQYQGPMDTDLVYDFNDVIIPRAGFAYRVTREFTLRGGIYYEPTGVTAQPAGFYPVGNDQIVPSVGLGYALALPGGILSNPLQIDAFFQYHVLLSKSFARANAQNPVTGDLDVSTSGSVFNMGLSLTFEF